VFQNVSSQKVKNKPNSKLKPYLALAYIDRVGRPSHKLHKSNFVERAMNATASSFNENDFCSDSFQILLENLTCDFVAHFSITYL
jgi:hypothetical protein